MNWKELFPADRPPSPADIEYHINFPLYHQFCEHIEKSYQSAPKIEYSKCGGAPGWNVKYKKGGRSICTIYPHEGFFTCLVCIGAKEADRAELVLSGCTEEIRRLYAHAKPFNGTRWLMIDVKNEETLRDVKELIRIRCS